MRKIVTLKDSITQEDVYPITPGKLVLDKNGSNILGVLDSEIRNFSELTIRDEEILMEQSLNKISELSGLDITDENVKELAKLVVENEKTKQGIKTIKEKIEDIKDTLDKLGDICKSSEVINLSNIIKIGKPNEIPIGKELRLDEDGNFYIGLDGLWYVVESSSISGKKNWIEEYLTFEAIEDTTFSFSKSGLSYSVDEGKTWKTLSSGSNTPTINSGKSIIFKGSLSGNTNSSYGTFSSTGKFKVAGNIMSLLFEDDFIEKTDLTGKNYAFYRLFSNCSKLEDISELILPATILSSYCYAYMFYNCTTITEVPSNVIQSTTTFTYCYHHMFDGCSNLTTVYLTIDSTSTECCSSMFKLCTSLVNVVDTIKLNAKSLSANCYANMFVSCSNLVYGPELPATTLATYCYSFMFQSCKSLVTAPILPAKTLYSNCYNRMFIDCSSLNYIEAYFLTTPGTSYTTNWVSGVASSGTFVKNSAATWNKTGVSGIPSRWTVEKIDVPNIYSVDSISIISEEESIDNPPAPELDYFTLDIDSVWIDSIEVWYKSLQLNIYPGSIEISNLVDQIKSEYPDDNEDSWKDIYFKITPFIPGDVILIYQNGVQVDYTINDSGDYILPELNINDYIEIKTIQS